MSRLELLGKNIRKFRELKGLTQKDIGTALNFTYEYVCRIERGQKYISLRKLFALADILGVDFKDLTNFK